jgi:ABC-type Fe3+ transport system permease subunit
MTGRAVGVLLLLPAGGFLLEALLGDGEPGFSARAWGHTLALAGTATAVGLFFGIPAGAVLAQSRRAFPAMLTGLPLVVPPVLGAGAWMGLGLPFPGPVGAGAILGGLFWPIVAFLLASALGGIPRAQLDAAALQLSPARAFRAVVWPAARPALAVAALLVFLLSASEFTVPSTFAVPAVAYVVFERLSAFQFGAAAGAALPLVALAILLAGLARRLPPLSPGESRPLLRGAASAAAWSLAGVAWGLTAVAPAFVWLRRVWGTSALARTIALYQDSLAWSFQVAGVAAFLLVVWAALTPRRSRLEPFWLLSLALPGAAVALGTLALAGRAGLHASLGPAGVLLVFTLMARFALVAWLPLRDAAERSPLEAAALAGLSRARTWRKIVWPAVRGRATAVGLVLLLLALAEVAPAVLLAPPGRQTVSLHLFNLMHFGYDETVASLCLLLFATAAAVVGLLTNVGVFRRAPVAR